jgi:hypothetical protein
VETGRTSTFGLLPAALALLAVALADRLGLDGAVFYLFLLGIPVTGAAAIAAFGRFVDAVDRGGDGSVERFQAFLAAFLVVVFVVGAASRSPMSLELEAPGLARVALVIGFLVLGAQGAASLLVPARR